MKITSIHKSKNTLLNRNEYVFEVSFDGSTPKRADIKQLFIQKTGENPDLSVIKRIQQHAGMRKVRVVAYVYANEDSLKRIEPAYVLKRNQLVKSDAEDSDKKS